MGSLTSEKTVVPQFEKSNGRRANILGLGTVLPAHILEQSSYPDVYFNFTNSEHMADLKDKFSRICAKTSIDTRYTCMTEEQRSNPKITGFTSASLDMRQQIVDHYLIRLGGEAALKAIDEWGRPATDITHLIFCSTTVGSSMPGPDFDIVKLLGLPLSTKRFLLPIQGCHGGGSVLRLAKDLAENNPESRVLVICSESIAIGYRGPQETLIGNLVGQGLFGDGMAALIVGAAPDLDIEKPLYEIVWTAQNLIEGSEEAIVAKLKEVGLLYNLKQEIPQLISKNIERLTLDALKNVGTSIEYNELFWMMHPGGRAILDEIEKALKLEKRKLGATREVLRKYGNQMSAGVLFVMEKMRRSSEEQGMRTVGEGLEWGLLFGIGPGTTVETVLLRCPTTRN